MIVTEKQAAEIACMEARVHSSDGKIGINAFARLVNGQRKDGPVHVIQPLMMCLGSKCMAWRWRWNDSETTIQQKTQRRGYCGKAGEAIHP